MKKIINLWEETLKTLRENNKSWEEVEIIFCDRGKISKELYESVAKKTNYNNSYGVHYIDLSLVIAGEDFKIIRNEYDGSEWFDFISYGVNVPTEEVNEEEFELKGDD